MTPAFTSVFCDFNGTITDGDMLHTLLLASTKDNEALPETCNANECLTLRERIALQASKITCTLEEAKSILERSLHLDKTFIDFSKICKKRSVELVVLSSGVQELILWYLSRHGLEAIPVIANSGEFDPRGWRISFRDGSPSGNAKVRYVDAARRVGKRTVVIGDDESDFEAAIAADRRFAKKHGKLERYLRERGLVYRSFTLFSEIVEEAVP